MRSDTWWSKLGEARLHSYIATCTKEMSACNINILSDKCCSCFIDPDTVLYIAMYMQSFIYKYDCLMRHHCDDSSISSVISGSSFYQVRMSSSSELSWTMAAAVKPFVPCTLQSVKIETDNIKFSHPAYNGSSNSHMMLPTLL